MQTIKTGIVVALLLAVCYGAFVALNAPDPDLPEGIEAWASGDENLEQLIGSLDSSLSPSMDSATALTPDQMLASLQNSDSAQKLVTTNAAVGGQGASTPVIPESTPFPSPNTSVAGVAATDSVGLPTMPSLSAGQNVGSFPPLGGTSLSTTGSDALAPTAPSSPTSLDVKQIGHPGAFPGSMGAHSESESSSLIPPLLDEDLASTSSGTPANYTSSAATNLPVVEFALARTQAIEKANRGELKEALVLMSSYYGSPELDYAENNDLIDLLDALSRDVIYSQSHHLEPAYTVSPVDSVASVAKAFNINPELVNAINGLGNAKALVPGKELKVVRGPFRARIDITRKELTIFLGNMYAGRFPISIGSDPSPHPGKFAVVDRQRNRTYYGKGAVVLTANDPRNPFGGYWMNLGDDLCIHGTSERTSSDLKDAGCISLAPLDAQHVFSILGVESQVEIHK